MAAYNVGDDREEISMRELADRIRAVTKAPGHVVRASTDPDYLTDNPQRRCPDLTKLRAWADRCRACPWKKGSRVRPLACSGDQARPAGGIMKVGVMGAGRRARERARALRAGTTSRSSTWIRRASHGCARASCPSSSRMPRHRCRLPHEVVDGP
jgi:hypothetical protein